MIQPVLLLCSLASNANPESAIPFFNTCVLVNSIRNAPVEKNNAQISACQLMNVKSKNEDIQNLVLLAEKTNNGDVTNEQKMTMLYYRKKKRT